MGSTYDELNQVLGRQQSENGDYFDPSTFVLVQQQVGASNVGTMATISAGVAGQEGAMSAATSPAVAEQQRESSNCFGAATAAPISSVPQQHEDSSLCLGGETAAAMSAVLLSLQEKVTHDRFRGKMRASAVPAAFSPSAPQQEQVTDDSFGGSTMTNTIPAVPGQEAATNDDHCFQSPMATASTISQQQGGTDDRSGGATKADIFEVSDVEAAAAAAAAAANGDDMSSASWLEEILQDDTTEQQHNLLAFDVQNQELPELTDHNYSQYNQSANLATRPQTQSITTQSPQSQDPQHVADAIRSQNLIIDSQALQYTDTGASCQDSTTGFGVSSSSGDIPQEQSNTEIEQTTLEEIRRNKRKQQNREAQRRLRKREKARTQALEEENQKLKEQNLLLENQCNAAVAVTNSLRAQVKMKDDLINRYISGSRGKFLAQAYQAC